MWKQARCSSSSAATVTGHSSINGSDGPRSPPSISTNRRGTKNGSLQRFEGNVDNGVSHMRGSTLVVLTSFALGAGSASVPPDLKALYDEKKYQQVVDGLSKLSQDAQASPEVRRLKVRTLVKLGTPQEALAEYDKLKAGLHQDDVPLLREVALGFIVV